MTNSKPISFWVDTGLTTQSDRKAFAENLKTSRDAHSDNMAKVIFTTLKVGGKITLLTFVYL